MKSEQLAKSPDLAASDSSSNTNAGAASGGSCGSAASESGEGFGIDDLRALAQLMQDFSLGELELCRSSGEKVRLARATAVAAMPAVLPVAPPAPAAAAAPAPPSAAHAAPPTNVHVITAPLVGTFYRSPSPDAPSFTEVGQRVRKGQTLCIIEAMKLMNELEAEVDGVVVAVLADNGRPVEFGQPLFHIQKG